MQIVSLQSPKSMRSLGIYLYSILKPLQRKCPSHAQVTKDPRTLLQLPDLVSGKGLLRKQYRERTHQRAAM